MSNKKTDIAALKELAYNLLETKIYETEFPTIIIHPIFESSITFIDGEMVNILESEEALSKAKEVMRKVIDRATSITDFLMIIRKSYYMAFMKYGNFFMSPEDYGKFLAEAWTIQENPNMDVNVSHEEARELFRNADPRYLMSEEDREYLEKQPDTLTLYRGVAEGRSYEGLSWTDSKEKAGWFAHRFGGEGIIREITISKNRVLAYFSNRDESEFVI